MFWRHDSNEIWNGAGDGRDTVSTSLHQRGDYLRAGDKEKVAQKLRSKGWSYRRIAEALEVPYRRIAQWLGAGPEPAPPAGPGPAAGSGSAPAEPPLSPPAALRAERPVLTAARPRPEPALAAARPRPAPVPAPTLVPVAAPVLAPVPPRPAAASPPATALPDPAADDPMVRALIERTELLCSRVDALVGSMEAERAAIAEERREQRQRDQKLIELLASLTLAIKGADRDGPPGAAGRTGGGGVPDAGAD